MRFLLLSLLLIGCVGVKIQPKPQNTQLQESKKDWEYLYSLELDSALKNQDFSAYRFFWPYYLEARYENKCKKYNEDHERDCLCKY